jgi:uncharacterized membrane protein YphA (DoxX/SURF4 family)
VATNVGAVGLGPQHRSPAKSTGWQRLISGLCWFVAFELFLFAPLKFSPVGLLGYPTYPEKFVAWGYPGWFAYVVGAAELLSAVLLLLPRRRFLGATLLAFILTGAVTTHIINHDSLGNSLAAPIDLVIAAVVALAYWPADWRDLFAHGGLASRSAWAPPSETR